MLRQYNKVVGYLDDVEAEYVERIVNEPDDIKVRQIQGSLFVLRELKKHINFGAR